jgi:hypothetical protein
LQSSAPGRTTRSQVVQSGHLANPIETLASRAMRQWA